MNMEFNFAHLNLQILIFFDCCKKHDLVIVDIVSLSIGVFINFHFINSFLIF